MLAAMDTRQLTEQERGLRRLLKKKLLGLASLERTIARQRSRIMWLREGDACTCFFHMHASHRRRKNSMDHLLVDGIRVTEHVDKARVVDDFYDSLLEDDQERPFSLDLDALGLPAVDLHHLEANFMVEEVWTAIKEMPMDKCPGPDGIP